MQAFMYTVPVLVMGNFCPYHYHSGCQSRNEYQDQEGCGPVLKHFATGLVGKVFTHIIDVVAGRCAYREACVPEKFVQ